jgi:hypothetical protein
MSALVVGAIVFACVFSGGVAGLYLSEILPAEHLGAPSKDVVKAATAMIATIAALVIGLLIASAKNSFETKQTELTKLSAQVILLDRELAQYGSETGQARDLIRSIAEARLRQIWPDEEGGPVEVNAIGQGDGIEAMQGMLRRLVPKNEEQRYLQSKALAISEEIAAARWLLFEQVRGSLQWPFMAILVFWLAVIFVSFGLSAPRNATVIVALLVSALSAAGAIFLIIQLDQPFGGLIRISSAPLRNAVSVLGRP